MSNRTFDKAGLNDPVLSFRQRARQWAELETYHVLLQDEQAVEWAETPVGYCRLDCVHDFATGQHELGIAVYRSEADEHGKLALDEVSEDVAQAALDMLMESGDDISAIPNLVDLHVSDAWQQIEDAQADAVLERRHQVGLRHIGAR